MDICRKISDTTVIIFIVILLFVLPAKPSFREYFRKAKTNLPLRPSPGLITWQFIHQKVPWSLILLMGAAFAFVEANRCSGLSLVMAADLVRFVYWPPLITMLIFCATAQCLTTFIPNVAAAAILAPIIATLVCARSSYP